MNGCHPSLSQVVLTHEDYSSLQWIKKIPTSASHYIKKSLSLSLPYSKYPYIRDFPPPPSTPGNPG